MTRIGEAVRIPRFLLDPGQLLGNRAVLTGADLHYCRVLRLRPGDAVRVGDGQGREFQGVLRVLTRQQAEIELGPEAAPAAEPPVRVTLFQGLARGEKLDWTLQKATELGVARFVPMLTERSQLHPQPESRRVRRWQEIARQAARQSGRAVVPEVAEPCAFAQAVQQAGQADLALMPFEAEVAGRSWKQAAAAAAGLRTVAVLVGPEGGFTAAEADTARQAGIQTVHLGPRILRSETAGMTAVALALYAWGDLGGAE